VEWSGVEWSKVEWSGVEWSGVEWSGQFGHPNFFEWRFPQAYIFKMPENLAKLNMIFFSRIL